MSADQDVTESHDCKTVNSNVDVKPSMKRYGVGVAEDVVEQHNSSEEELEKFYMSLIKEVGCDESQKIFACSYYFYVDLTDEQAEKLAGLENVENVSQPSEVLRLPYEVVKQDTLTWLC